MTEIALAWKMARRELRGGLKGFRIFFLCLLLGTAAIAAVESLSDAFLNGLRDSGQVLLGGDVAVNLVHRPATPQERAFFGRYGKVAETTSMRAMAYALRDGRETERELVELKSVDDHWPLFGRPIFSPAASVADAIHCEDDGICGAAAEQTLLDRLHVKRGDLVKVGDATFRIIAALDKEPDRISAGFSLGPHLLISSHGLPATGLVQPGSLIDYSYRIAFRPGVTIAGFKADAARAFPDAGWQIHDRNDAAPGIRRFVEQVSMFLTLVGLTVLGVGGVGASEAVAAFLDRKRYDIAILKSLGADGPLVFLIFFLQVMAIAVGALILGASLGATAPFLLAHFYGSVLPLPPELGIYPGPLLLAAGFGLLSAIAFSVPPLGRAREIPSASLLRETVAPARARPRMGYIVAASLSGLGIAGLMLGLAPSPLYAGEFLGGAIILLVLLRLVAEGLTRALRKLPRPRSPLARLAVGDLTRPGAATQGVITALGLGLTLLATVILIDRTMGQEVDDSLPSRAPSFFFVDIQPDEVQAFDHTIQSFKTAEDYKRTPMIRGRITSLNGVPSAKAKVSSDVKWALSGDRGITYASVPPPGTVITSGQW
ncbi:MAG TPA: FtsX-like permease family protein, partial [Rhizomicrobium sp.]|nr:FtsX-like permease family protein [Rhizomicrobium sp.]